MRTCTHLTGDTLGKCGKPATWHVEGTIFAPHDCCDKHKRDLEEHTADWRRKPTITRIEDQ